MLVIHFTTIIVWFVLFFFRIYSAVNPVRVLSLANSHTIPAGMWRSNQTKMRRQPTRISVKKSKHFR